MSQHDFILLDRSGSMEGPMWTESLNAINSYVQKLADDKVDTGVTLVVFDSQEPFVIIRDRITPSTWKPVTNEDAQPRGLTPLNDSTAKLVDLAEKGPPWGGQYEKVAIVVVTDGAENASSEYRDPAAIRARLDRCRAKGWQVLFLGANFDNQQQAAQYGAVGGHQVQSSMVNLGATMNMMASKRGLYATGASATMAYTEEEKTSLKSDEPKKAS